MTFRRLIFWIHLGTGCLAGAVFLFLAITGSLLTYQRQMVAWAERDLRSVVPASGSGNGVSLQALLQAATRDKEKAASSLVVSADPAAPVEILFGKDERLFLDRYSGANLGEGATGVRSFFRTVTGFHRWFGASPDKKPLAKAIKGIFDIALLLMICTGLYLWWPKSWTKTRLRTSALFRRDLTGRACDWNRHNVIGLWTSVPLAIITLTGLILTYSWANNLLYGLTGSPLPQSATTVQESKLETPAATTGFLDIDQLFASAQQQAIGWHTLTLYIPKAKDRKVIIVVDFDNGTRPDQRVQLLFDRTSGAVIQLETFSSYSLGKRIRLFIKNIHTGEAGGLVGQTISGLASLGCCALVFTGLQLAARRFSGRKRSSSAKTRENETESVTI